MESLEEYMKANGYTLGEDASRWSALGYVVMGLYANGVITGDEW